MSKGGTGVDRRRVGLVVEGAPAREGAEIVDESGASIGKVTSGCPSPTMGKHIAMAYVKNGMHKAGTEVQVVVRGKKRKAVEKDGEGEEVSVTDRWCHFIESHQICVIFN